MKAEINLLPPKTTKRVGYLGPVLKLEVRCCCRPDNLFGFMRVPLEAIQRNRMFVPGPNGEVEEISFERYRASIAIAKYYFDRIQDPALRRKFRPGLATAFDDTPAFYDDEYLAVKSDERPIEWWRALPDFEEASDSQKIEGTMAYRQFRLLQRVGAIPSSITFYEHERRIANGESIVNPGPPDPVTGI